MLTLLTKQETFDAGLTAFDKEGIQAITALKDQLVAANHDQTDAILKRYADVKSRYSDNPSKTKFVHAAIHITHTVLQIYYEVLTTHEASHSNM